MDIGETLTHKYGPLPGYAWVGVGTVGILLIARLRGGSSSQPGNVTLTPASDGAGVSGPDLSGLDAGGGAGGGDASGDSTASPDVQPTGPLLIQIPASAPPTVQPLSPAASVIQPVIQVTPTPSPVKTQAQFQQASGVPATATPTSLQATVGTPNKAAVYKATPQENNPVAVKVKANSSGASANKTQGVFSIH